MRNALIILTMFLLPVTGNGQTGIASWYGKNHQGKKTANGERFNMKELTAAHKKLPFGTLVEVTNLENGLKVIVRINDRGPFIRNRIIDLSKKAATILDIKGTAKVKIKTIGEEV